MSEKPREKRRYGKDVEPRDFVRFVLKVQEKERKMSLLDRLRRLLNLLKKVKEA